MFWPIAENMQLTRHLEYFTLDNTTMNGSALDQIAQQLKGIGIPFKPQQHRIRCLGHVINVTLESHIRRNHSVTNDYDLLEEFNND
jgi:hypothetical protein